MGLNQQPGSGPRPGAGLPTPANAPPNGWGAQAPQWTGQQQTAGPSPMPVSKPRPAGQYGSGGGGGAPAGDYDMSQPGTYENWWKQNSGQFDQPWSSEQYWTQNQGQFQQGANGLHNYAQDYRGMFDPNQKSYAEQLFGSSPGMGAYYDRAIETGSKDLNNALAARGLFDSGAGLEQNRELVKDIRADQSRNEADYTLRQAQAADTGYFNRMNQGRSWADALFNQDQGSANSALNYLQAGGTAAAASDAGRNTRLGMGMRGAGAAQDAREGRINTGFNNIFRTNQAASGDYMGALVKQIAIDTGISEEEVNALLAKSGFDQKAAERDRTALQGDVSNGIKAYKTYQTGGVG